MISGLGIKMADYSLDTNIALWMLSEPAKLTKKVLKILQDKESQLFLSVVTIWELQIKSQIGKLTLPYTLIEMQDELITQFNVIVQSVRMEHVYVLQGLPLIHRDPFDRMIIAQAIYHDHILISADTIFSAYPVNVVWE
jgi:PIN domain nuclease of toxin-antitoxin system